MVTILSLWLPILLSAAAVFLMSSVLHMALSYHENDFAKLPNEDEGRAAIRQLNIPPGDYVVPKPANSKDMSTPEFIAKTEEGPVLWMTVLPSGLFDMKKSLAQWFGLSVVISVFAAYIAGRALGPGADYLAVFRFVGCTAFVGYSIGLIQNSIWYGRKWSATCKSMFDGLIYALLTAGVFGWLWP